MKVFGVMRQGDNLTPVGWMESVPPGSEKTLKTGGREYRAVGGEIKREKDVFARLFAMNLKPHLDLLTALHPETGRRLADIKSEVDHVTVSGKKHVQYFDVISGS